MKAIDFKEFRINRNWPSFGKYTVDHYVPVKSLKGTLVCTHIFYPDPNKQIRIYSFCKKELPKEVTDFIRLIHNLNLT